MPTNLSPGGRARLVRALLGLAALASVVVPLSLRVSWPARAADHKDAPLVAEDAAADIADIYAFASPETSGNLVVAMTVNPLSVPGSLGYGFSPNVLYTFHLDIDGDLASDLDIRASFQAAALGAPQRMTVTGLGAPLVGQTTPPTVGTSASFPFTFGAGGVRVFAGPRDDPFFADIVGLLRYLGGPFTPVNGLRGAGDFPADTFAGTNVSAIVIEIPPPLPATVRAWATTRRAPMTNNSHLVNQWNHWQGARAAAGQDPDDWQAFRRHERAIGAPDPGATPIAFRQVDRMAIPAINTVLVASASKDAFNQASPVNDARDYRDGTAAIIAALRSAVAAVLAAEDSPGLAADTLASVVIPDVVTIDTSKPIVFPNGRRLTDDVVDAALGLVLNRGNPLGGGAGVSDGVSVNDKAFLSTFPYLAPPHQPR